MGFENAVHRSLDHRNPSEHPVIVEAYKKATQSLKTNAMNPDDFRGFYSDESIKADQDLVALRKSQFEHDEIKKTSDVLEAVIFEHIELSDWLGQGVETVRASEYDDIERGVDFITEFSLEGFTNHLALGVDVTFGTTSMSKKFQRIKDEIDKDTLTAVKYFESHSFKGELRNIPRTIIGVEKETVISLAALWIRDQKAELANHFAQDIIAREILEQLSAFRSYAESINAEKSVRSYTQAITILASSIRSHTDDMCRKRIQAHHEEIASDRVYRDIQAHLEAFKPASKTR